MLHMPCDDDSERFILDSARERARTLLNAVGGDLDSLRAAASDAVYADGVTHCEAVADATRALMAQLGADLQQTQSSNENPRP